MAGRVELRGREGGRRESEIVRCEKFRLSVCSRVPNERTTERQEGKQSRQNEAIEIWAGMKAVY